MIRNIEHLPDLEAAIANRLDGPSKDLFDYLLKVPDGQSASNLVEIGALSHDVSANAPKITTVKKVTNHLCKQLGIEPPIFETKGKKEATITGRALLYHTLNPKADPQTLLECVELEKYINGGIVVEQITIDPKSAEIVVSMMMDRFKDLRDPLKPKPEVTDRLMLVQALAFAGQTIELNGTASDTALDVEPKPVKPKEDHIKNFLESKPELKNLAKKLTGYIYDSKNLSEKDWAQLEQQASETTIVELVELLSSQAIGGEDMTVTRLNLIRETIGLVPATKARYTSWGAAVSGASLPK